MFKKLIWIRPVLVYRKVMKYKPEDLKRLHEELYIILAEIVRVCDKCGIQYFIQGGSAIGAFYNQGIIPWDDDIDVGMTRDNYERFLKEAPAELGRDFFLEWFGSESNTPFYFAKVKKNNTLFIEESFKNVDIHHGIFVDIFPYDRVPDVSLHQKLHRLHLKFWISCFVGKQIWMWKYAKKCEIDTPQKKSWLGCWAILFICTLFSREKIYKRMVSVSSRYNKRDYKYVNIVRMPKDQIRRTCIERPVLMPFGPLKVWVPADVETYLRHHYPNLRPVLPEHEQINHAPYRLSFNVNADQVK